MTQTVSEPKPSPVTKPSPVPIPSDRPDPQAVPHGVRRSFTAAYKLAILTEVDQLNDFGAIASLLRREGLYSSHLSKWQHQRTIGSLSALDAHHRGPKSKLDSRDDEIARLKRELARSETKLHHAQIIIDVQKKISQLLDFSTLMPLGTDPR